MRTGEVVNARDSEVDRIDPPGIGWINHDHGNATNGGTPTGPKRCVADAVQRDEPPSVSVESRGLHLAE